MNKGAYDEKTEVGDIFRKYGHAYRRSFSLPLQSIKTMEALEQCRTSALGGHIDKCDHCGHLRISYNSCRNRHCPKCQSLVKERWLLARKKELLPVDYFHIVFTIPNDLNDLALINQIAVYNLLFRAASETLLTLSKDLKHLGAQIGFMGVLHTWGQNLMHHPHLHCVIPGGGLSTDGSKWISTKNKFFLPVKVLSGIFKGKFLFYLRKAYENNELIFTGNILHFANRHHFKQFLDKLYCKEWVIYAKKPFNGPEQVLEYLGRYTHRVAISNNRIKKLENDQVTFSWRDYNDDSRTKQMSLEAFEFIRRFLLHVLPNGFFKIRYFGILSSRNRKTKLKKCMGILGMKLSTLKDEVSKDWKVLLFELTGMDPAICPCCGKGKMILTVEFNPGEDPPI